jgi:hypothetical protein
VLNDIIEDNVDDGVRFDDDIMTDWKKEEDEEEEEEDDGISDRDLFGEDSSAENIPQRALSLLKHMKYFNDHKSQSESKSESKSEKENGDTEANKINNRIGGGNNDEYENEDENEHMIEYKHYNKHVNERCWTSDERYSVTEVSDFNTIDDLNIEN